MTVHGSFGVVEFVVYSVYVHGRPNFDLPPFKLRLMLYIRLRGFDGHASKAKAPFPLETPSRNTLHLPPDPSDPNTERPPALGTSTATSPSPAESPLAGEQPLLL